VDDARSALIVASDAYSDPGLRQLRAPASDAQALAAVLQNPQIGGFQVQTLLNQPAHEINEAVDEFFADRRPDDLLLLHFSCHGVKDEGGELYFAAANTKLRRLGATAVAAEFVNRRMNRSRSRRVVLLLDCCYAGAFERGMTARAGTGMAIEEQFGGRGRAVITASSAMEYAFEGDELADTKELAPSVFTSALVEGLRTGEADRDQDGMVALDELYDYVYDKVRAATPNQTPGKWTFGVQGSLYIARRGRPVTKPAPLRPELQEAIDSPFVLIRKGVVPELSRLLRSQHAGLALAARLTLEQLTRDDSRAVSAEATAALSAQTRTDLAPLADRQDTAQPTHVIGHPTANWRLSRVGMLEHSSEWKLLGSKAVYEVASSLDGRRIASGSSDKTVQLWDVASGSLQHTLHHDSEVRAVTFSPNGQLLAGSGDKTVQLWDVASGSLQHTLHHEDWVEAVEFSPDGRLLAAGAGGSRAVLYTVQPRQGRLPVVPSSP
jgi:hypothetical protein